TPGPTGVIPLPYTSIGTTQDASSFSKKVFVGGSPALNTGDKISRTTGDEPGLEGGVISGTTSGPVKPLMGSGKVKVDGQPAALHTLPTGQNGSPPNALGSAQTPSQTKVAAGG
ncbi:MAG: DUF4150 domain-containing protein, partial [Janthinobacterium lividum]